MRVERISSLAELHDEWRALAAATRNVFATPDWAALWGEHFGEGRELLVHACRSADGRLAGVLPLYVWRRRPFRVLRLVGHGPADELGPICLPEDRVAVAAALRSVLAAARADVFLAERTARADGWDTLLAAREIRAEPSPVVRFAAPTWDEFVRSRSRNFRDQARRRERRLGEQHEVRFRLSDSETLDRDLDALFSLHRARWGGTPTNFGRCEAFHGAFAARALEQGWLRLWLLELDGEPRAALHGFRVGDVESFYQSGRDPAFDDRSVGFVCLLNAIREALADGMSEYRLLLGGESYKYRFANEDREVATLAWARTRAARTTLTAAVAARRSRAGRRLAAWRTYT